MLKTNLPNTIASYSEAFAFLKELYDNQEAWHPEDSPHDIDLFTKEDADKLEELIQQIYELAIDPCDIYCTIMEQDPENLWFRGNQNI